MNTESNNILQQALSLSESERADIAASLFLSLDLESDADADQLWAAEIKNRLDSIDNGSAKMVPWSDVKSKMSSRRKQ